MVNLLRKKKTNSKVVLINPQKRFNIISYPKPYERFFPEDEPVKDKHIHERIIFKCNSCNNEIEFTDNDFEKHQKKEISNLNESDKTEIENFIKQKEDFDKLSHLDFYCPNCKLPIRVLFEGGWGGKVGEYGFVIKRIIEIIKNNESPTKANSAYRN